MIVERDHQVVTEDCCDARFLLVQPEREAEALASTQWSPRSARRLLRLTDYRRKELILLAIEQLN